jgi:hypothetical protein
MIYFLSIFTTIFLFTGIIYLGHKKQHYSHIKHTISELGERGGKNSHLASYGLFLPVGILLLIISLSGENKTVQGFAACISAGYILSAFFPCDAGSPIKGGWRQQIHNLAGVIEYAGGVYFLFMASEKNEELFSFGYKIIAVIILGCVIITAIPKIPIRGLAQRIAELLLFASLIDLTA